MTTFIAAGTRWPCPNCKRLQAFQRGIAKEALPIILKCGFADCKFSQAFSTLDADTPPKFPKVDPVNITQGNWEIVYQEPEKPAWQEAGTGGQVSFRKRANAISGHLAAAFECVESLRYDLNQLVDAMTCQLEGEWGIHTNFLRFWNPAKVNAFMKMPFLALKTLATNENVRLRTRLILHPQFFLPELGLPINGLGGMLIQLITPYTQFTFPLERWFSSLCEVPEQLQLRCYYGENGSSKIVGRDLHLCWKDIPGCYTDSDHLEDAPSIRIAAGNREARCWLATMGVPPWPKQELTREDFLASGLDYFETTSPTPKQRRAFATFRNCGRLGYFVSGPDARMAAWEFCMSVGTFGIGQKLCIIGDPRLQKTYSGLAREATGPTTMSRYFHWKVVRDLEDILQGDMGSSMIPWQSFKYIFVDYTPDTPLELLQYLQLYTGRLVIVHHDPLMDTLESNIEASHFHACLNGVHYDDYVPGSQDSFDYELAEHSVVTAILRSWKKEE